MKIELLSLYALLPQLFKMTLPEMSLTGAVFIIFIILLRMLTKRCLPNRIFVFLWYAAVFRLLLPFSFSSGLTGIGRFWISAKHTIPQAEAGTISQTLQMPVSVYLPAEEGAMTGNMPVLPLVQMIWLGGCLLSAICFFIIYIRCRRKFREALPLENPAVNEIINDTHFFRQVAVRSLDRIDVPLTYGIFRPVILLPRSLTAVKADRDALRCVVLHECVHIRRFDALLKLLLTAVCVIHWFNPAVYAMYFLASRDIELACDEAVIRRLGVQGRSVYATALLNMEESRHTCSAVYNCFGKNALEERITMIMKKKISAGITAVAAILSICAVLIVFSGRTEAKREEGPESWNTSEYSSKTPEYEETESGEENSAADFIAEAEEEHVGTAGKAEFIWVAEGCDRITSTFGERVHPITGEIRSQDHITISALDNQERKGAAVFAAADGVVSETGFEYDKGNYILLDHGNGLSTLYTHCDEIYAETGEKVAQGDTIAALGQTGKATGVCLGFYVYQDEIPQDPMEYLPVLR